MAVSALAAAPATAHPEDELCTAGDAGLDPELCRALASLDSTEDAVPDIAPLQGDPGSERGFWPTAGRYVTIGVRHILPGGLDHILFVLALFLASRTLGALAWQVSAFTVAHTATLALAAGGAIAPPSAVVEPLIAATIAFVAVENVALPSLTRWRVALVFLFGLVHGLGFAGFFGDLGLPPGQFLGALLGFNVGVEVGQLAVVVLAACIARVARRQLPVVRDDAGWRRYAVVPASLAIAMAGGFWTVERMAAAMA